MMKTGKTFHIILVALLLFPFACTKQLSAINTDGDGVAVKGYDPVAYFTAGMPVEGRAEFSYQWQGATWRFASEENRKMFMDAPGKYMPQYGGY